MGQKETEHANQEIKELKEELQKNKTISEIEFKFEEKKMRAREQALLRIHAQMEKKLLEELESLKEAEEMETTVHKSAQSYLEVKLGEKQEEKKRWEDDFERETAEREVDLTMLKDKRQVGYQELQELNDKKNAEAAMHKEKENEMRNAVLIEKQRREQVERMREAILFLQEEGRRYFKRMEARKAAAKGKKGKKGKKK